jgi:hypothetical protein
MHAKPLVAKWVFDNIAKLQLVCNKQAVKSSVATTLTNADIGYVSKAPDAPDGLNKPEQMPV